MKFIFSILFFFLTNHIFSLDYILEFQANINILKEFDISKKEKFRSYEVIGTFTDKYGNYGKFDGIVTSDVKDSKLIIFNIRYYYTFQLTIIAKIICKGSN